MLELKNVGAGYGEAVVLEDVSLELPADRSLAVLGRNGVGKSTLLLTIMGYTRLHQGRRIAAHLRRVGGRRLGRDTGLPGTHRQVVTPRDGVRRRKAHAHECRGSCLL
jgi:ABC-type branched-subunit amino acid transport system ATPase component